MKLNRRFVKFSIIAVATVTMLVVLTPAFAQRPEPAGYPIDWTSKHVIYRPGISLEEVQKIERDPRYWRQKFVTEHNAAIATGPREFRDIFRLLKDKKKPVPTPGDPLTVDWAVSLGTGNVAQNMYPAKYSFVTDGTPSCSDWVVFGLNVAPAANQATLFAVNNLYGTANGCTANPGVLFSYRTVGPIATSPVISFNDNGVQVAYVDNEGGKATLVVLKYKAGDGMAAAAPTSVPGAGSQVSFQYSATTNTNSSPYIDYVNDAVYIGDDGGKLYKISPVFGGGTPGLVWSATLAGKLTGPIWDQLHNVVLVASDNGKLYSQKGTDGTAAAVTSPLLVGTGAIIDPPVVVTGTTSYAFVTDNCNASGSGNNSSDSVLFEASVSGPTGSTFGQSAAVSIGNLHKACATNNFHAPALDDASYNGSAGFIYACGTVSAGGNPGNGPFAPELYSFNFNPNNGSVGTTPADMVAPTGTTATDECSPITYFTNNSTAKIFWGMGSATDGTANSATVSAGSLPAANAITQDTTPNGVGGTSAIIIDNASATSSLANVYFSGRSAGNITAGATPGSCKSFAVTGSNSGTTVTLSGASFNFSVGTTVVVAGFTGTPAFYNGTFVLTGATATSLTYTDTAAVSNTSQTGTGHTASWGTCGFQLTQSGLN